MHFALSSGLFAKGHSSVNYKNFKHFDNIFRLDIGSQNWESIKSFDNPNQIWRAWKSMFNSVVDRHTPLRTKRVKGSKSPWITADLKQRIRERDILKIKATQSKNLHDWSIFKASRNSVNNEIIQAKEIYYRRTFSENENNLEKTWYIINEITSRKQSNPHIKEVSSNGSSITDSQEICEMFDYHFATIGPKLAEDIPVTETSHLENLATQNHVIFQNYVNRKLLV